MTNGGGSSGFGAGLWVVDSEKLMQGEYWTNRYIVAAASLAEATAIGNQIVGIERTIHYTPVLFTKYRVSDGVPLTDVYQVFNVNLYGQGIGDVNSMLPLFNVVRCDFNTAGGGRPSRKYLRGCMGEGQIQFNAIDPGTLTNINTNYAQGLVDLLGFVDVDGQEITSGSVYPFVGMRQLRRGSKRKAPTSGTTV
jgi:hypothetical protein